MGEGKCCHQAGGPGGVGVSVNWRKKRDRVLQDPPPLPSSLPPSSHTSRSRIPFPCSSCCCCIFRNIGSVSGQKHELSHGWSGQYLLLCWKISLVSAETQTFPPLLPFLSFPLFALFHMRPCFFIYLFILQT